MNNAILMCSRTAIFWLMVVVLLLNVSNGVGGWQEQREKTANQDPAPVLPQDTLPPTENLLRSQPLLGFEALPADDPAGPLTEAKVSLGRRLFFDPILSKDRTVSCASCHQPNHGLASPDPLAVGIGGKQGRRNAPSVFNRGYGKRQFWDGRAATLEEQSLQPISNPDEMGEALEPILVRLRDDQKYVSEFSKAFGQSESAAEVVTSTRLASALAAFQRCLLIGDSPVDRFRAADVKELSMEARQGLWIFESRGRCWQCHSGENFTDELFHNTGVSFGSENRDLGRSEISHDPQDRHRFKTPSLRGVAETAPYMHDGSIKTLEEVVEFYNRGGSPNDTELSPHLRPLNLSVDERRFLVEFLRALSPSREPMQDQ